MKEIIEKNKNGKFDLKHNEWENFSKDCKDLVKRMLHQNPLKRITLKGICRSKWIKSYQAKKSDEKNMGKKLKFINKASTFDKTEVNISEESLQFKVDSKFPHISPKSITKTSKELSNGTKNEKFAIFLCPTYFENYSVF